MTLKILNDEKDFSRELADLKYLLLDFDGTLVDYYTNEFTALSKILTELSIPESQHENIVLKYRGINEMLWKKFEKKLVDLDEVRYNRFTLLNNEFGLDLDPVEFNTKYIDNFANFAVAFPGIVEKLTDFRQTHPEISVIIVTNGADQVQHIRSEKVGIKEIVDGIVSSDLVGVAKPAVGIFDYTKNHYNIEFDNSLMVGDSLSSDILGAVNAGITNCYINPQLDQFNDTDLHNLDPKPDMVTTNCVNLLDYISGIRNND